MVWQYVLLRWRRLSKTFVMEGRFRVSHDSVAYIVIRNHIHASFKSYWHSYDFERLPREFFNPRYDTFSCGPFTATILGFRLSLISKFMGPTWGPSGADRPHVGPMLAPWTSLSGVILYTKWQNDKTTTHRNFVRFEFKLGVGVCFLSLLLCPCTVWLSGSCSMCNVPTVYGKYANNVICNILRAPPSVCRRNYWTHGISGSTVSFGRTQEVNTSNTIKWFYEDGVDSNFPSQWASNVELWCLIVVSLNKLLDKEWSNRWVEDAMALMCIHCNAHDISGV